MNARFEMNCFGGNSTRMRITGKFLFAIALTAASMVGLAANSASAALIDNLLGYYQFEADGSDSSGNSRETTLMGTAAISAGGLFGNALNLTDNVPGISGEANGWAQRSHEPAYDFGTSDYTVQAWLNLDGGTYPGPNGNGEVVVTEQFLGGGGPGWTFYWRTHEATMFLYDTGTNAHGQGTSLGAGWHQLLVRRAAGTYSLFFDGADISTSALASGANIATTGDFFIGRRNPDDGRPFAVDGLMDEVALWNRALSNQEVGDLYNNGQGQIIPEPNSLILVVLGMGAVLLAMRRRR